MSRYIVQFMKVVLGENGREAEICQRSMEVDAATARFRAGCVLRALGFVAGCRGCVLRTASASIASSSALLFLSLIDRLP